MIDLLAQAKKDAALVATSGGFQAAITLSRPDGSGMVSLTGLSTGRWEAFDNEGNKQNSESIHVAVPEVALILAGYAVRNSAGNVALNGHLVTRADNTGTIRHYVVNECYPNDTTGLIMLILGKSKAP